MQLIMKKDGACLHVYSYYLQLFLTHSNWVSVYDAVIITCTNAN